MLSSRSVFSILSVLVVAGLFIQGRGAPPDAAPSPAPARASGEPPSDHARDRKVDELEKDVEALWDLQEESLASQAEGDEVRAAKADVPTQEAVSPEDMTIRMRGTYEAALMDEPRDPEWSAQAHDAVEERLDALGGAISSVERLECRSSLCVVEFHYDVGESDLGGLADALSQLAPWPAQATSSLSTTGDQRGWIYLSREGRALPGV